MKKDIGVAAVGDVLDINTWSNIPYYFYEAGERAGIFTQPWRFNPDFLKNDRILWNLFQMVTFQGKGGYQYSDRFLNKAEASITPAYFSSNVISFNQLFPRASSIRKAGGRMFYYIDIPLYELFKFEQYNINIPDSVKQKALDQERENYRIADAVVCMGSWIAPTLREFYKLPENKVKQILPGANIQSSLRPTTGFSPGAGISRPLRLGFIGKDWKRKGLPLLVDVAQKLKAKGVDVKVVIIGNAPGEYKQHPLVEDFGFIDKRKETQKFINAVSSCDIGCVFSSAEALGISTLEFLFCSVPVAGFYHQGMIDTLIEGASIRFNPNDDADAISAVIEKIVKDPNGMAKLHGKAASISNDVTWDACVQKWRKIIE